MLIWFWLVNIPTNCSHLWLALAKGPLCQLSIPHFPCPTTELLKTWREKTGVCQEWVMIFWLLQYLWGSEKHASTSAWDGQRKFLVPLYRFALHYYNNQSEKLKFFNRFSWHIISSEVAACVELSWVSIQHIWQEISTYLFLSTKSFPLPVFR